MNDDLPPHTPLDQGLQIPYQSIRYVPGFCEQVVHEYATEYAKRAVAAKQARIDELMLEYCPNEMTAEQKAEWAKHQVQAPLQWEQLDGRTGWPPGLLQDDSRELSRALASKPDAMVHARDAVAKIGQPEAPTAAPLAVKQSLADWRRHYDARPEDVLRGYNYTEFVQVGEYFETLLAHPPARSGAGSEDAPNHFRDTTEMVQPSQPD